MQKFYGTYDQQLKETSTNPYNTNAECNEYNGVKKFSHAIEEPDSKKIIPLNKVDFICRN